MDAARSYLLGFLSIVPPAILVLISVFEPVLLKGKGTGSDLSDILDGVVLTCIVLAVATLVFFIGHIWRTTDPRLEGKKGLWVVLLLLGSVIALPVFWLLYLRNPSSTPSPGK